MQNLAYPSKKTGQGLVEYILIVGLMGVLAITAINALSNQTKKGYSAATSKLETEFAKFRG